MMLRNYLSLFSKRFAKENGIFDIVMYGSAVKGEEEPADMDILLIFLEKKLKERLEIAQKFKQSIREKVKKADVKTINIGEVFDSNFLARQGVLIEGYSLLHGVSLAKRLGFEGNVLFNYGLRNLNHNDKTRFTYSLIGRRGEEGMIKKVGGASLGKGVVLVPIGNSLIFENFLKTWRLEYKRKDVMVSLR